MLFPIPLAVRGNCRDAGGLFAFWAANSTLYHCPLTSASASAVWILPSDKAEIRAKSLAPNLPGGPNFMGFDTQKPPPNSG
jgi:hypothetical protein